MAKEQRLAAEVAANAKRDAKQHEADAKKEVELQRIQLERDVFNAKERSQKRERNQERKKKNKERKRRRKAGESDVSSDSDLSD